MTAENQILALLSADVLDRLTPHLEQVTLSQGSIVHQPGEPLLHIFFPLDCLFSITITMQDGATAEVGMVGNQEVLGLNALMGNSATTQTAYMVQIAGNAMRIEVQRLEEEFKRYDELHNLLLRYT
ncbi:MULTISPECIES: Crp/Fnr family transcriptional regulator [Cyanophyceae]|uniref:Cyclic nucleotide-binding domain-containing protein n=1 Tax=Stenomitos frigidus AS-A4 TaxID=2933935 RepID=A0ABV0KIU6_9CYAN|nr:Crp/Fnr family transcriptional regulator [Phormidium sp. FACHB-592]